VATLLSVLALIVTPYGARSAGYTLHVLLNASLGMTRIQEYLPLSDERLKIFVVLLLAFLSAQVVLRPKYRLDDFGLLLVTVYGTFVHKRLLLFCIPVFTPFLAALLARWVPEYEPAKDKYPLNAVLMVTAAVVAWVNFFPSRSDLQKAVDTAFPRGAVEYLQRHAVPGRMMNPDFWGAYLIRNLGREHKIFIDGNTQLFEDAGVLEDSLRIGDVDRDTALLLRKYGLDSCLTYRWGALATYLSASPDWEQVYQDNLAVIFVRKTPLGAETQVDTGKSKMEIGKPKLKVHITPYVVLKPPGLVMLSPSLRSRSNSAWHLSSLHGRLGKKRDSSPRRALQNDSLYFDFPVSISSTR